MLLEFFINKSFARAKSVMHAKRADVVLFSESWFSIGVDYDGMLMMMVEWVVGRMRLVGVIVRVVFILLKLNAILSVVAIKMNVWRNVHFTFFPSSYSIFLPLISNHFPRVLL